jgi:hypothetical protein
VGNLIEPKGEKMIKRLLSFALALVLVIGVIPVSSISAGSTTKAYSDVTLSGGYQAGHFDDVWDLTQADMVISFTYNARGLVDDSGCHAWAEFGVRSLGNGDFNPTWDVEGSGVWLATDYDWTTDTFDPDPAGAPTLDLDDKLLLQKAGGHGEGDYNLPSTPPFPGNNHRFWFDRDGVDQWQAQSPLAVNGGTYNTEGIYNIVIRLHATSETTGDAYMTINGLDQGFETNGNWNDMELSPAGMTFTGDLKRLQVFYGLYGYGAIHSVSFTNISVQGVVVGIGVTVRLIDHNGSPLGGGVVKWADGSWHSVPGQTDATSGKLSFVISNPSYTKIAMTFNQGTIEQNRTQLAASNFTWQTNRLRIWLKDHNGNPITDQKGTVDQGGGYWYRHGNTNSEGYLDVELFPSSTPYKFKVTYNYTSLTKYPIVNGNVEETFQTQEAVVTLRVNCTQNMIDGAAVEYASGAWYKFGTTGDFAPGSGKVTMELFPGTYNIRLTYNYATNTISHDLSTPFDFVAVPLTLVGVKNAQYAGGSWCTFTLPTMNLLPGTYRFRIDGVEQSIVVDASKCGQTYGCLTLLDQNGKGVPGGVATPAYGGSWGSQLPGQTDSNGKLYASLPSGYTKIKMTINQSGQEQTLAQLNASNYTWYTVPIVIELRDNEGKLLPGSGSLYSPEGGKVEQGGSYWYTHGYTGDSGQFTVQVFGGQNFKFRMTWEKKSQEITQYIPPEGGIITFQTGKVTLLTGKSLSLGSWVYFPAGTYQFLPGTYNIQGGGSFTVTAGGEVTVP